MRTRVKGDLHRGFVLRDTAGTIVYDIEEDARYGSDEAAIEHARDVGDSLFPGQHLIAEVVVIHGFKLVLADAPTHIVYADANPAWDIPDAMTEGHRVSDLINAGTHVPTRDADGTWRLDAAPDPESAPRIDSE